MHFVMITLALGLAWLIRLMRFQNHQDFNSRWQSSLFLFVFPPLLVLMTAFAVISMGYQGTMFGFHASFLSYLFAVLLLICAVWYLVKFAFQARLTWQKIQVLSDVEVAGKTAKFLDTSFPYSAQIGFWRPELVVSQGLLELLDKNHLEAVLYHEQAHLDSRDTFWFFWLGWLRSVTLWLPNTERLWQELLFLREVRADQYAAQRSDSLLLAESLYVVAQNIAQDASFEIEESYGAAFNDPLPSNRLIGRIEALLDGNSSQSVLPWWRWSWLLLGLIPLLTLPWHS